jgi:hypothetical protein
MTTEIKRAYKFSDVVMLTSISTIVENAITHKTALIAKRSTWGDPFFSNLKLRIDTLIQTYIGVDSAKSLRNATQTLLAIQEIALEKLSFFKVQIDADFKKTPVRKNEILNLLGFNTYYQDSYKNKSQDALINLLFQFKKNIDASLKTEITAKGTDATSIAEIIAFANNLNTANISQETFKSNRPTITEQAIIAFNDLYNDVISVSTISSKLFTKDKAIKESFSYNKLAAAQKSISPKTKTTQPPTPQ